MNSNPELNIGAVLLVQSISDSLSASYSDNADTRNSETSASRAKEKRAYEMLSSGSNKEIEKAFYADVKDVNQSDAQLLSGMSINWGKISPTHKYINEVAKEKVNLAQRTDRIGDAVMDVINKQQKKLFQHKLESPRRPIGLLAAFKMGGYKRDLSTWQKESDKISSRIESLHDRRNITAEYLHPSISLSKLAIAKVDKAFPKLAGLVEIKDKNPIVLQGSEKLPEIER